MCTHEISYLETPAESSEHQGSMVAHYQHTFYNSGIEHANDALSKVCHKTSEHYNVQECQVNEQDQELELVEVEKTDNVLVESCNGMAWYKSLSHVCSQ